MTPMRLQRISKTTGDVILATIASTVGYPSDSLTSCFTFWFIAVHVPTTFCQLVNIIFTYLLI